MVTLEDIHKEAERVTVFEQAPELKYIPINSVWEHHGGNFYRVKLHANVDSVHLDKYPIVIIYEGVHNGKLWTRTLNDWHRGMRCISLT